MLDLRDIPVFEGSHADALIKRGKVDDEWRQGLWVQRTPDGNLWLWYTDAEKSHPICKGDADGIWTDGAAAIYLARGALKGVKAREER